jgi:hypothetical protein
MKRVSITKKKTKRLTDYEREFERAKPLVKERSRDWCESHEFVLSWTARPISDDMALAVAEFFLIPCFRFGSHVHHRKIRKQGGSNSLSNLLNLCLVCHTFIHANPETSYKLGLLLHAWESEEL